MIPENYNKLGAVADPDPGGWRETMDVNLTGPFLMMRAATPKVIEGGGGSRSTSLRSGP